MGDGTDPNDKAVADLQWVIANADDYELQPFQADKMCKHERTSEPIGVRGRILDALDADRITMRQALALLNECRQRRGVEAGGRVTEDGEIVPIGGG